MNIRTLSIINVVLAIAVAILFVLHFSGKQKTELKNDSDYNKLKVTENKNTPIAPPPHTDSSKILKIAYVNSDTVASYFEFSKDIEYKLKKRQASAEVQLKKLYQQYEKERQAFEKEAPIMGQSEMQRRAQEIGLLEQQIMQKEQELSAKLNQMEMDIMADYVHKTNDYMQKIGKRLGYDYIMSYRIGGPMLYANSKFDITKEIVDLLNKEYKKSKEQKQPSS